ncbi:G1/S-specific cyclin-E1-like [Tropilaelaps mercedesae]|uniref:G1/S-specific cyclin-E1-like n=1 Tax=Tropilaelaps mercedesae TaxID=418985 RepID=A0A1V9XW84_9ACAR|nr:G1/S-specific cyclin-E1-like [Tropilaelaps mercedesae]
MSSERQQPKYACAYVDTATQSSLVPRGSSFEDIKNKNQQPIRKGNCASTSSRPPASSTTVLSVEKSDSIYKANNKRTFDKNVRGSESNDKMTNENIPTASTTGLTKVRSSACAESSRESAKRSAATASARSWNKKSPLKETPQKQYGNRGRISSHEANTPEGNTIRSYLLRLPRAMPRQLRWAIGDDLWSVIHSKQTKTRGQGSMVRILRSHPAIKPQMRAILLSWIIEVCDVYNQLRDTYYLAMDLFDRYLLATENLPKEQLQLVGITCLFIAGKMEEIYPPQINEYSYVSDGACTDPQIISKELAILTALKWDICPMTANNWLTLFLQLSQLNPISTITAVSDTGGSTDNLLKPNICPHDFNACAQLLDLCTLCMESVCFSPLHIAACVVSHVLGPDEMERVSGLNSTVIEACHQWMHPFALVLREQSPSKAATSTDFNKQGNNVSLVLLDEARSKRAQMNLERQTFQGKSSAAGSSHGSGSNNAGEATPTKTPTSTRKRNFLDDMTPPSTAKQMRFSDENRR